MEKEVLDAFEAAKKAADAAADGGGAPEVDRCVDSLRHLRRINLTMKVLVDTQVGKRIRCLTKHPQERIHSAASDLLDFWKKVVREETSKDSKKIGIQQDKNSAKIESESERAEIVKVEKVVNAGVVDYISTSSKVEKISVTGMKVEGSKLASIKIEKAEPGRCMVGNGRGSMLVDKIPGEKEGSSVIKKPSSSSLNPLKLTSMIKCNNPARDKIREMLAEAFSRVSKETSGCDREEIRNIGDEVDACDPIRVTVTVESAMFEKLGPSTGAHKAKYRSILFNLKDNKNIDFRRKVLMEELKAEGIVDLTPEEMASDDRKVSNQQIKEKALFECERAAAPKATTDQFKCGRCGQRKCTYYQMQTRSADEPMTTFVTCVNCNKHWKFC